MKNERRNGFVILGRFWGSSRVASLVEEIVEAGACALFIDSSGGSREGHFMNVRFQFNMTQDL